MGFNVIVVRIDGNGKIKVYFKDGISFDDWMWGIGKERIIRKIF